MDQDSRLIVAICIGSSRLQGAIGLWLNLPESYPKQARFYTDFWEAYRSVFPTESHQAVVKDTGQTNHIERFNLILRQRVSRV